MPDRTFPFSPRSTASLEVGDLIAVPGEASDWGCLQVVDVRRVGPGSRTTFIAGVLPWRGQSAPMRDDVAGLAAIENGLVPVELFTKGGLQVVDHSELAASDLPSSFWDMWVGATHKVWGWRTAIQKALVAG